jgi:hypothetical protein
MPCSVGRSYLAGVIAGLSLISPLASALAGFNKPILPGYKIFGILSRL